MKYNNPQIEIVLPEIINLCQIVTANGLSTKIHIAPTNDSVRRVSDLTHVLDVEEVSFFYNDKQEALEDQSTLREYLRRQGINVVKVTRQKPLTLNATS